MPANTSDEATFKLNLDTGGVNGAAASAADRLTLLENKIEGDTKALRAMNAALKQLQAGTNPNTKTLEALTKRISSQKQKIAEARSEYINLGGTFRKIKRPVDDARNGLKGWSDAATAAGGPVAGLIGRARSLMALVGAGGPLAVGFALVAAAALASAAAIGVAAAALVKYGFAAAGARREEKLRLEGLTKMIFWHQQWANGFRRAHDSAEFLQSTLDRVSDKVALGRGEIEQYTNRLYKMGLRGGSLQQALEGVSIAASTVGEGQANMYLQMMMGAAMTGRSIKQVTDHIKAKLGPLAEKQLLTWNVQTTKLRENLGRLFADVGIENFLRPMKTFTDLFSQSEVVGRALKGILERMFKPLETSMPTIALLAKRFVQGMVLGALMIEIAYRKLKIALIKAIGPSTFKQLGAGFDIMTVAVYAGGMAVAAMVAPTAALGVALGVVAATAYGAYVGIKKLASIVTTAADSMKRDHPKIVSVGKFIAEGLAKGVINGTPAAVSSIVTMGAGMLTALKKKLGIASPSRHGIAIGGFTTQGIAIGVERRKPMLQRALNTIAEVPLKMRLRPIKLPDVSVDRPQNRPANLNAIKPDRRAPVQVTIQNLTIEAPQGADPNDFAAAVKRALVNELEGLAIELGAA